MRQVHACAHGDGRRAWSISHRPKRGPSAGPAWHWPATATSAGSVVAAEGGGDHATPHRATQPRSGRIGAGAFASLGGRAARALSLAGKNGRLARALESAATAPNWRGVGNWGFGVSPKFQFEVEMHARPRHSPLDNLVGGANCGYPSRAPERAVVLLYKIANVTS